MGSDLNRRLIIFALVFLAAILFLVPTLSTIASGEKFTSSWISKPLSLGLDLRGGVYLLYEVQAKEAVKSQLLTVGQNICSSLHSEKIGCKKGVNENFELWIELLTERHTEKVKAKILNDYKEVSFLRLDTSSGKARLFYGVGEAEAARIEGYAIDQAIETLRNRVDQSGVAEPLIQKMGTKRIALQMPGHHDIEAVKKIVGSVAKLEFRLIPLPSNTGNTAPLKNREGNPVVVEDDVLMTGDAVADARVGFDQTNMAEVNLSFTSLGGKTFGKITSENVQRQMAIILDGVVYSHPVIREPIWGGQAQISGGFTVEEAQQLAIVLRAGALPAPLTVLEESVVGPSLGKQSIDNGVNAIIIGFLLIIVFMVVYYRKSGTIAIVSLFLNLVLILALLSAFGATLTLPGLAGLALTIGMAVDANVIIFERIRDELKLGTGRDAAVALGFEKAISAVVDSNITTLLSGLILYYFGTGPIRGFAVTLCVGILTTLYCATFATRIFFDAFKLSSAKAELSV